MAIGTIRLNSGIRSDIFDLLSRSGAVAPCSELKRRGASLSLFAGAIRDIIARHEHGLSYKEPRDIDVGVGAITRQAFDEIMLQFEATPNRYGGYKISKDSKPVLEFWRLEETVGLRKSNVECTLQNVLRSFVLNCNAISYDPFSDTCVDAGAYDAIRTNQIDFVDNAIMHDESVFASKVIVLAFRCAFVPSPAVKHYVRHYWTPGTLQHELKKNLSDDVKSRILDCHVNDRPISRYRWIFETKIPIMDIIRSLQSVRICDKSMEGIRTDCTDIKDQQKESYRRR